MKPHKLMKPHVVSKHCWWSTQILWAERAYLIFFIALPWAKLSDSVVFTRTRAGTSLTRATPPLAGSRQKSISVIWITMRVALRVKRCQLKPLARTQDRCWQRSWRRGTLDRTIILRRKIVFLDPILIFQNWNCHLNFSVQLRIKFRNTDFL